MIVSGVVIWFEESKNGVIVPIELYKKAEIQVVPKYQIQTFLSNINPFVYK